MCYSENFPNFSLFVEANCRVKKTSTLKPALNKRNPGIQYTPLYFPTGNPF